MTASFFPRPLRAAALFLVLSAGPALSADIVSPTISNFEITDCEGNLQAATLNTSTQSPNVRVSVQDTGTSHVSGLRFESAEHSSRPVNLWNTVLHLKFNNDWSDGSRFSNVITTNSVDFVASVNGNFGQSSNWNAGGDYIQVANSTAMASTTDYLTIQMWIRPGQTGNPSSIAQWDDLSTSGVLFWQDWSSNVYTNLRDTDSVNHVLRAGAGTLDENTWDMLTLTYNGGTAKIYRDDVLRATTDFHVPNLETLYDFWLGQYPSGMPGGHVEFTGRMDNVRVLNRALSETAVKNDYWSGRMEAPAGTTYFQIGTHYISGSTTQGSHEKVTAEVTQVRLNPGNNDLTFIFGDMAGRASSLKRTINVTLTVPDTPRDFTGTAQGTSSITWTWNRGDRLCLINAGEAGETLGLFRVIAATDSTVLLAVNEPTHSFNEVGLVLNTTHTRHIYAVDDYGSSPLSLSATVYTHANPANNANMNVLSTGSVTVSWGANSNPNWTRWEVSVSTDGFATVNSTPVTITDNHKTTTASFGGLEEATTYYYRIRAKNGRAEDVFGSVMTAFEAGSSTSAPTLPGPHPNLAAAAQGRSSITWSWAARPTALQYVLQFEDGTASTDTALSYTRTGLQTNVNYGARLRVDNQSGQGLYTDWVWMYTNAQAPITLSVTDVTTNYISLSWDAQTNPGYTNYQLYVASSSSFVGVVTTHTVTGTAATVRSLLPGNTYYFRVRGLSVNTNPTDYSNTVWAVTDGESPISQIPSPPSPYDLSPGQVGLWHFDESSGTVVSDSSSFRNDGTLTCISVNCSTPTYTTGLSGLGAAVRFSGIQNSLCHVLHDASLNVGAGDGLTIEAWVNPETSLQLSTATIIAKGSSTAESYALDLYQGKWRFRVRSDVYVSSAVSSTQSFKVGEWAHIAGVFNPDAAGRELSIYVDGVLSKTIDPGFSNLLGLSQPLTFGSFQTDTSPETYAKGFTGEVDEIHIIMSSMTSSEVMSSYEAARSSQVTLPWPNQDTSVTVPPDAFGGETTIIVSSAPSAAPLSIDLDILSDALSSPPTGMTLIPDTLTEIIASRGGFQLTENFSSSITVTLTYPDSDGNTLVDGTSPPIPASNLRMFTLDPTVVRWIELPLTEPVDTANKSVSALTGHFSIFALFGPTGIRPNVNYVRAYPVPWKPGGGDRFDSVTYLGRTGMAFDNLSTAGTISIFTISGEFVVGLSYGAPEAGTLIWDGTNHAGKRVASGVYFAYVKSTDGSTSMIKIAIER